MVCAASAAPRLKLTQSAFTESIVPGSNGPTEALNAANIGDGTLNLQAAASVPWLTATVGAKTSCSLGNCLPVQIALQTSSLAAGTYTGTVTLNDPNALDDPQFVTVTVMVGGDVPDKLEFFLPPGGSVSQDFITATPVKSAITPSVPWLSVAVDGQGTFRFNVPYKLSINIPSGAAAGDSTASVALTGSSFAPDNKSIAVTLHVTTQPILQSSATTVSLTGTQGAIKQNTALAITNGGQGTLTVSGVTAAAAQSGTWLTAQSVNNGAGVAITADPSSLTPNTYQGTVTIASNAANSSVVIPVQFIVEAQGPPIASVGGAVNNGTFGSGEALAQGDIAAVFGDQFTLGDLAYPSGLPLPTNVNGTQVMINNVPAPLYFISNGQIDFEIPFEVSPGNATLRVVRNGQQGNMIAIKIAASTPRFLLINGGPFAVLNTPSTPPLVTGTPDHPAKGGDTVIAYVIGLGQTSPPVATGVAAPGKPLATLNDVKVCIGENTPFSKPDCFTPDFAGLTPGLVGLYQLNIKIPGVHPAGTTSMFFVVGNQPSNVVQIAFE